MPNDARSMRLWRIVRSAILCWILTGNPLWTEARIIVDGFFQDWTTITPTLTLSDPAGDFYNDSLDLLELKLSHDSLYLYLNIRLNCEFNLQNKNGLVLYIDSDHQSVTGKQAGLIGAELEWRFGDRIGYWYQSGDSIRLYHEMIGLISAPTVTSNQFELAIRRGVSTHPDNGIPMGDSIRISLVSRGDRLPDGVSGITYFLTPTTSPSLDLPELLKTDSSHLRIVTYNCLQDSLFNSDKQPHFQRILQAIDPDIIGFQEIYDHSAEETQILLESWLPGPGYSARIDPDLILISRYPILESLPIGTNAAFLVDIRPRSELPLLIILAHLPSSNQESKRQAEIDQMMAFVRDAQTGNALPGLSPHSPMIIMGDMNLVGLSRQVETLVSGDIDDNGGYGPDYLPDWGQDSLRDLMPVTSGLPAVFTWLSTHSTYPPGRLDYLLYTSSRLKAESSLALYTPSMPQSWLNRYGLLAEDSPAATDHCPVIGDFSIIPETPVSENHSFDPLSLNLRIYPNPFSQSLTIALSGRFNHDLPLVISIHSLDGRQVYSEIVESGISDRIGTISESENADHPNDYLNDHTLRWLWNGRDQHGRFVSTGIYLIAVRQGNQQAVSKAVRLK